jgi:hypothetical protein
MPTGWENQLTKQIGEHLVCVELGRLGLLATPFAGNVPLFDLLAADKHGRSVPIQVKTIKGPSWQFSDVRQFLDVEIVNGVQRVRGKISLPNPDLVCVFVLLLQDRNYEFYIFKLRDLQEYFAAIYKGGSRPRNPNSMHCAVWPTDLT